MQQRLVEGAARFGWDKHSPEPRSCEIVDTSLGQGVNGATYPHWRWPAKARVTTSSDGTALVEALIFPKDSISQALREHRGGEGGIRTPDRLAPMPHFECGAFDHSATSPGAITGDSSTRGRGVF
jgi:hypothetical protein